LQAAPEFPNPLSTQEYRSGDAAINCEDMVSAYFSTFPPPMWHSCTGGSAES